MQGSCHVSEADFAVLLEYCKLSFSARRPSCAAKRGASMARPLLASVRNDKVSASGGCVELLPLGDLAGRRPILCRSHGLGSWQDFYEVEQQRHVICSSRAVLHSGGKRFNANGRRREVALRYSSS